MFSSIPFRDKPEYSRVSSESSVEDQAEVEQLQTSAFLRQRASSHSTWAWAAQAIFFLTSCAIFLSGLRLHHGSAAECHDDDFLPMWSPAFEAVKGTGHFHRFDGSFATPNKYKGTPRPEIDENWSRVEYSTGGVISIDEETLLAVNGSTENSVKLAPELGGGYMASVEVLHQLHCLNMLRQATYEDYYRDKAEPWEDPPQILRYHLDHCIDNLRQKLMCEADTGILTYVWVKDHPAPFPDFNVQHKCRNYEAVRDWVTEHQTFTPKDFKIERQPGYQELESPP